MAEFDNFDDFDIDEEAEEVSTITVNFPDSLGECIDRLYKLRTFRLKQEKEIKERKRTENAYRSHIINLLGDVNLEGGRGTVATASIKSSEEPTAKDWSEIYAYIEANDAFDLLQRRLSAKAVKQRWELGEEVPGIEKFTVVDLSLTKRS